MLKMLLIIVLVVAVVLFICCGKVEALAHEQTGHPGVDGIMPVILPETLKIERDKIIIVDEV